MGRHPKVGIPVESSAGLAGHDSAAESARNTPVPPGIGGGVLLGNQAELARPGDGFGAVGRAKLAQQVADVLLHGVGGEPISRGWVTVRAHHNGRRWCPGTA